MEKLRSTSSAEEEIVRVMAPNASSNRIVHAISPSQMGQGEKGPSVIGPSTIGPSAMGPSDTINDIAALAALSDLDHDERIEKVVQRMEL